MIDPGSFILGMLAHSVLVITLVFVLMTARELRLTRRAPPLRPLAREPGVTRVDGPVIWPEDIARAWRDGTAFVIKGGKR